MCTGGMCCLISYIKKRKKKILKNDEWKERSKVK